MKIKKGRGPVEKIVMKTKATHDAKPESCEWWKIKDEAERAAGLCGTAAYLKQNQTWRLRQLATSIRLYCGLSVYSWAGSNVAKMDQTKTLPPDRPTFNLIQSVVDTIVSRMAQNRPAPKFLTDNADYHQRHLAEELNHFIQGEFYQVKAYEKAPQMLRDTCIMGTGALKVYEGDDKRVCVDRVMVTDLYVDLNDAINGEPQVLYQFKLVNRDKLSALFPKSKKMIIDAGSSQPYQGADSGTVSDQVLVIEAWKLPTVKGAGDGLHLMACDSGEVDSEEWTKDSFPFVFMRYSNPFLGFFGQGIASRLFGTQMTLDRILYTIARAITLVGIPRVFVEQNSKVVKAHLNNEIGVIVTYSGVKPSYEVAPCNAPELYTERDKLIQYGYDQEGISQMQASAQKPLGLDSGEAQRIYNDTADARRAETEKKYDQVFIDLAYKITDVAMDIAKREGSYQTVYPNKDGTKEIDLPAMKFLDDPFVIQCFNESSLPKDPGGRAQAIIERVQSGMITLREGRRLLGSLDTEQMDQLANASEERIFQILDDIVEHGKYKPDFFGMDFQLASQLCVQYYNLYIAAKLEEKKAALLRIFFEQVQAMQAQAQPPQVPGALPAPGGPAGPGQAPANPEAAPTSPLVPNTNAGAAAA